MNRSDRAAVRDWLLIVVCAGTLSQWIGKGVGMVIIAVALTCGWKP